MMYDDVHHGSLAKTKIYTWMYMKRFCDNPEVRRSWHSSQWVCWLVLEDWIASVLNGITYLDGFPTMKVRVWRYKFISILSYDEKHDNHGCEDSFVLFISTIFDWIGDFRSFRRRIPAATETGSHSFMPSTTLKTAYLIILRMTTRQSMGPWSLLGVPLNEFVSEMEIFPLPVPHWFIYRDRFRRHSIPLRPGMMPHSSTHPISRQPFWRGSLHGDHWTGFVFENETIPPWCPHLCSYGDGLRWPFSTHLPRNDS